MAGLLNRRTAYYIKYRWNPINLENTHFDVYLGHGVVLLERGFAAFWVR